MTAGLLIPAMLLDAALGEPRAVWERVPHPAVVMGRAVAAGDRWLNTGHARRLRGAVLISALLIGALGLGTLVGTLPGGAVIEVLLAAILLAQRSLADHVGAVATGLRYGIDAGRQAVARIVGRDTTGMDDAAVARAAIESASENFSDGVVAPAFWFLLGGLPALLVYKAVNTADSMIGYRTERHREFGWAAARLDDLLNWIPARLTAVVVVIAGMRGVRWRDIAADARRHRSPNAGWPEAAAARALGVSLAGPRSYDGAIRDFPFVNAGAPAPGIAEIDAAVALIWRGWGILLALVALIAVV